MQKKEQASVTLISLVLVTVLMLLVTALATSMIGEIRMSASEQDQTKAFYLAEAGLEYGRYIINDDAWGDKETDDEGNQYQNPATEDWWENMVEEESAEIELRKYDDKLRSIAHYNSGQKTIDINFGAFDPDNVGFFGDVADLEEKDNDDFDKKTTIIENAHIDDEEIDIELNGSKHTIKNVKMESEGGAGIKIGNKSSIEDTTIEAEGDVEIDFGGSEATMTNVRIKTEGDVTIKDMGNDSTMKCVVIEAGGNVTIDMHQNHWTMENVLIFTEGDFKDGERSNQTSGFEDGTDYYKISPDQKETYDYSGFDCGGGDSDNVSWQEI